MKNIHNKIIKIITTIKEIINIKIKIRKLRLEKIINKIYLAIRKILLMFWFDNIVENYELKHQIKIIKNKIFDIKYYSIKWVRLNRTWIIIIIVTIIFAIDYIIFLTILSSIR